MQLTKNFSLSEMIHTSHDVDNKPSAIHIANLKLLCENILQPLRDYMNEPIHVNSGYRNPILNRLVKGAINSHHTLGTCADITCGTRDKNKKMFNWILFKFTTIS